MTEKQALHCMKFNCELTVCEECDVYGTVGTDHCFEDACREAIKALEKQIPKKYMYEELKPYGTQNLCPICNSIIQYGKVYCSECGQAIKWE